jgi:hypothetical protein
MAVGENQNHHKKPNPKTKTEPKTNRLPTADEKRGKKKKKKRGKKKCNVWQRHSIKIELLLLCKRKKRGKKNYLIKKLICKKSLKSLSTNKQRTIKKAIATSRNKKGAKKRKRKRGKKYNVWQRHSIINITALALKEKKRNKKFVCDKLQQNKDYSFAVKKKGKKRKRKKGQKKYNVATPQHKN